MGSSPAQDRVDWDAVRLDRQDPYLRGLSLNIFVHELDKSLRFYVDQLGFGIVVDESYESGAFGWRPRLPMAKQFWPLLLLDVTPRNTS